MIVIYEMAVHPKSRTQKWKNCVYHEFGLLFKAKKPITLQERKHWIWKWIKECGEMKKCPGIGFCKWNDDLFCS